MFDPFGGDDSMGAWLFEQQRIEAEKEYKKKHEERVIKYNSQTNYTFDLSHQESLDYDDDETTLYEDDDDITLFYDNVTIVSDNEVTKLCSTIGESSIKTMNLNDLNEVAQGLIMLNDINAIVEFNIVLALKKPDYSTAYNEANGQHALLERFKKGVLELAMNYIDKEDKEGIAVCYNATNIVNNKIDEFIKIKKALFYKKFPALRLA